MERGGRVRIVKTVGKMTEASRRITANNCSISEICYEVGPNRKENKMSSKEVLHR